MARKFLTSIDLAKNELQNAVVQNLATDPASPVLGQVYFNTLSNEMRIYNGTAFEAIGLNGVTASAADINILTNTLVSSTELNYLDGVTSSVQTQINTKAPSASPTFTGTVTLDTGVDIVFEGATANSFETTLTAGDPTADRTVTLPDRTTTLVGQDTTDTLTNKTLTSPVVSGLTLSDSSIVVEGATNDNFETTLSFVDPTADRTIYVPNADGTLARVENKLHDFAVATSSVDLNSQKIINLATPTAATDAANKQYVDDVAQGLHIHAASFAATTAALTATYSNGTAGVGATLTNSGTQAAFVTDGVTPTVGTRILVRNQATASQNGIYTVTDTGSVSTNWVLTRATDFDSAVEIAGGDFTFVDTGSTLANTGWVSATEVTTVGTDPIEFVQFSGAGTFLAGNGLTLAGSTFNVGAGTGITVNSDDVAIDTAVVVRKYASDIGNGSATSITVTHNLGTRDVTVALYDPASSYAEVVADVEHTTTNTITVKFSIAPTTNQYRVVVHG